MEIEYWDRSLPLHPGHPVSISSAEAKCAASCSEPAGSWGGWAQYPKSSQLRVASLSEGQVIVAQGKSRVLGCCGIELPWESSEAGQEKCRQGSRTTGRKTPGGAVAKLTLQVIPCSLQETQRTMAPGGVLKLLPLPDFLSVFPGYWAICPISKWELTCSPVMEAFSALIGCQVKCSWEQGCQHVYSPRVIFHFMYI